jgi:PAS domain S-box-containing protein
MLGVVMDITQRKAAESRLEAQHAITRALVESSSPNEAVPKVLQTICEALDWSLGQLWVVDPAADVLQRSAVWRRTTRLQAFEQDARLSFARGASLPGQVWASAQPAWVEDLHAESDLGRSQAFARDGLRSAFAFPILLDAQVMGVMEFFSLRPRRADGELLQTASDLGAQIGQFIERRRAQEALRDSEERYRTTLSSIGDAVIAADAQGCVQFINAVAQELTGWSQREAVRRRLDEVFRVVPEDGQKAMADPVRRVLESGAPAALESSAVLVARDGKQIPVDDSAAPIRNDAGDLIGVVLVFRDVRSRRRAEEALRSSEKLAATGRLAASIAHEINNPMEAVTNLLYLIENHPGLDDTAREYARLADQELGRMDKIVKQTLGFYRESAEPVPVRIASVLDNVLELYARRLQRAGVQVQKRYRAEGEVKAFPGEMRQVFSNLISNALEALGEEGRLGVRVSRGHDWKGEGRPGVRVTVADNGTGIARENLHRIFEPFFTTKGVNGTGLGLWITYGIIQKHGGTIHVRSRTSGPRRGTCFSVFLPDFHRDAASQPARSAADPAVPHAA